MTGRGRAGSTFVKPTAYRFRQGKKVEREAEKKSPLRTEEEEKKAREHKKT